ncbi:hypothetical protein Nepgr_029542 [Nepenthes gracilis]|uniref:Uncharacterized protein n=1 Tax=Nepenthes gracilis TaxID=150966 RepID=A0AAD3TEC2_NEPGR|nr:hypothetical protein Nepgr_029542 [Nepenthes gracilis]
MRLEIDGPVEVPPSQMPRRPSRRSRQVNPTLPSRKWVVKVAADAALAELASCQDHSRQSLETTQQIDVTYAKCLYLGDINGSIDRRKGGTSRCLKGTSLATL